MEPALSFLLCMDSGTDRPGLYGRRIRQPALSQLPDAGEIRPPLESHQGHDFGASALEEDCPERAAAVQRRATADLSGGRVRPFPLDRMDGTRDVVRGDVSA